MSFGVVICHGGVGSHYGLAFPLRLQEHMHACGQAQRHRGEGQTKAENASIMGHHDLLYQRYLLKQARAQEAAIWIVRKGCKVLGTASDPCLKGPMK